MRWTRRRRETGGVSAYGEVVWSWRPDAGAKPFDLREATVTTKPGLTGVITK